MYIRKDIHKSLRLEAKMADGSHCFSWAKLFRECSYLLRQKDREIEKLRAALRLYAEGQWSDGYPGGVQIDDNTLDFGDIARAALEGKESAE